MNDYNDLVERCKEILAWKKTGLLKGDALRTYADNLPEYIQGELHQAELATASEAMKAVLVLVEHVAELEVNRTSLKDSLTWAIREIDRNTCPHEDTYRGGTIWTICSSCGKKWADDEGGFTPYEEPSELTEARKLVDQ